MLQTFTFQNAARTGALLTMLILLAGWTTPAAAQVPPAATTEAQVLDALCVIARAQENYYVSRGAFADSLSALNTADTPPFLECDYSLAVTGYTFTMQASGLSFTVAATPPAAGRHYRVDESKTFRFQENAPATPASTPIVHTCPDTHPCASAARETIRANEAAAIDSLCAIRSAQDQYFDANGEFGLGFAELIPFGLPNVDWSASQNGYLFTLGGSANVFDCTASPEIQNVSGERGFYLDASATLRQSPDGAATAANDALPQQCTGQATLAQAGGLAFDILCAIVQAQKSFQRVNGYFASDFAELDDDSNGPAYLEGSLSDITAGYDFILNGSFSDFEVTAVPAEVTATLPLHFYADETGVIRVNLLAEANAADSPAVGADCPDTPPFLNQARQRIMANEAAAQADLCTVIDAQRAFYEDFGRFSVIDFAELTDDSNGPPYLDGDWDASRNGYVFIIGGSGQKFDCSVVADEQGVTGIRGYYVDATGTIRYDESGSATAASEPSRQQCHWDGSPETAAQAAAQVMCAIIEAQKLFFETYQRYASYLEELTNNPAGPSFLSGDFSSTLGGYEFDLSANSTHQYDLTAYPAAEDNENFFIYYYADQSGVIRSQRTSAADVYSPPANVACSSDPPYLNWLRRQVTENEAAAQANLCAIVDAQWAHFDALGGFALDLYELIPYGLPEVEWGDSLSGYDFSTGGTSSNFECYATAEETDITGVRGYFVDASGVIRYEESGLAVATSRETQQQCHWDGSPETAAQAAGQVMCAIIKAQDLYFHTYQTYANTLDDLREDSNGISFLTGDFGSELGGYQFNYSIFSSSYYELTAVPVVPAIEDFVTYYADRSGIIRTATGTEADWDSPPANIACNANPPYLNRLRRQISENETAAQADLCTVIDAQWSFHNDNFRFANDFAELTDNSNGTSYLDGDWDAPRNGYGFIMGGGSQNFTCNADPTDLGATGIRGFFVDASGTIRYDESGAATAASEPTQQQCHWDGSPDTASQAAAQVLCAIIEAQELYFRAFQAYAIDFVQLSDATNGPAFLDGDLSSILAGYVFQIDVTSGTQYTLTAVPDIPGEFSIYYFADQTGVIRSEIDAEAGPESPPADIACRNKPPYLNLLRRNIVRNEARAQANLCAVIEAQVAYFDANAAYTQDFADLIEVGLPDVDWFDSVRGYAFVLGGDAESFTCTATPAEAGVTGTFYFFTDASGVIRRDCCGEANAESDVVSIDCQNLPAEGEGEGAEDGEGSTEGEGSVDGEGTGDGEGEGEGTPEGEGSTDGEGEGTTDGEGAFEGEGAIDGEGEPVPLTDVVFVDASSTFAKIDLVGLSWPTAVSSLQAGIDLAETLGRSEVWVARGVYSEATDIELAPGIAVYGGFAGSEAERGQRDPLRNVSIIDGAQANGGDGALHVVVGAQDARVDGFTIRGGVGDGAGLLAQGIAMQVWNCIFRDNTAARFGGGILAVSGAEITVIDSVFRDNTADINGGGVSVSNAFATLQGCLFYRNTSNSAGGGIYLGGDSQVSLLSCRITENEALNGAGIGGAGSAGVTVNGTWIGRNTAAQLGGGVQLNNASNVLFVDTVFSLNRSDIHGGALHLVGTSPLISQCTFVGNSSDSRGGALYNQQGSNPNIVNTIISATPNEVIGNTDTSSPEINYSLIQGVAVAGTGNLQGNPAFVNAANEVYGLGLGSQAVDTGRNTSAPEFGGATTDFVGNARGTDGDGFGAISGDFSEYDMGAFEAPYDGAVGDSREVPKPEHSGDTNQDFAFDLSELLRIIQLYNADGFGCAEETEDGFDPTAEDQECDPHSSDYLEEDFIVSLSELLRSVQLYNLSGYYLCPGVTEDDFCGVI